MTKTRSLIANVALVASVVGGALIGCSATDGSTESVSATGEALRPDRYDWWRGERADRTATFNAYLSDNAEQFSSFNQCAYF